MKSEEADQIVKTMKEKRLFEDEKISEYVKSTGKVNSKEDMIQVLTSMIRHHDNYPNFFVDKQILACATKSEEYAFLIAEASKVKRFTPNLSELVKLYGAEPSIVDFVYENLNRVKDEGSSVPMGYLLGGLGQIDPEKLFGIIRDNKYPSVKERVAYTVALHITSEKHKIPDELIDFVVSNSDSEDWRLKQTAINVMADAFGSEKRVEDKLITLTKKDDDTARIIAYIMGPTVRKRKELAMKVLEECSKTSNAQVAGEVAQQLGMLAPHFPIECLTILKRWTENSAFGHMFYNDWFISQIGKGDIEKVGKFLDEWISSEKNPQTLAFHLPSIINQIYSGNDSKLMQLIKTLDYKQKEKAVLIVNTLDAVLSGGYREVRREESFLTDCKEVLLKIALEMSIDATVEPSIKSPYMQTMAIIKAIKGRNKKIEPANAKKILDDLPNLVSFLEKRKIEELIENKSFHPLVRLLSNASSIRSNLEEQLQKIGKSSDWKNPKLVNFPAGRFYPLAFLMDIDAAIGILKSEKQGMARMKDGLLDENNFFQTVTELVIAARLKRAHKILLQPRVGNNRLDIDMEVEGKRHLIEIYSPRGDIGLKFVNTVHGMKDKAKESIVEKVLSQMKAAVSENVPVILVVDNSQAPEVGEYEIINWLLGTYQWVLLFDDKGHAVGDSSTRAKDSISDVSPYGKVVSAVVLTYREIDYNDYRIKLYGKIFLNPQASIQLDEKTVKILEETIFLNSIVD